MSTATLCPFCAYNSSGRLSIPAISPSSPPGRGKKYSAGHDSGVEYDGSNSGSNTPKGPSIGSISPHGQEDAPRGSRFPANAFPESYPSFPGAYASHHTIIQCENGRIQSLPETCWMCRRTNSSVRDRAVHDRFESFSSNPSMQYQPIRSESHGTEYYTPPNSGSFNQDYENRAVLQSMPSTSSESYSSITSRPDYISLPREIEEEYRGISIQESTGMTPHYPDLSPQRVLFKLNEKLLTPNPSDKRYVEIRDYMNMGEIGRGGQGTCFYAMDRKKERMFAYKMTNNEEDTSKLLSECKILSELCHEHVVLFLGAVDEVVDGKVRMFMELAECGTIEQQFKDNPDFQVDTIFIAHLFEQVLQGVNYLHQKCILHRDIKGENILLFEDSRCKLTDFGLAVHADNISKDNCVKGTCPFVSPEYVRSQVYTYSCDVWSTMTVAVEMLTGKSPWHHTNNNAHMMFMIGNYSAGSHFNKLVPERELERQLREAFPSDENLAPVMYYYQGILAMMKSVFHEDTTRRPSAYDLLRTEVMRRAPDVYDEASDSDYSQLLTSQPEHGQCDVVPRSCHGMGRETAYSSVQQPIAHFKNSKSWPMNCAEYRDYLDSGRRLSCITRRCGSAKGEFRRALSYQHQCGGETQSYVRRHSLAETYVMKGPDTDSEFKKVLQ